MAIVIYDQLKYKSMYIHIIATQINKTNIDNSLNDRRSSTMECAEDSVAAYILQRLQNVVSKMALA